jgi:hypothetical protein
MVLSLLGPQRPTPILAQTLDDLGVDGPVALVSSGWQEREGEDAELAAHVGRPVVNLRLFARTEEVFEREPLLLAALTERQDRLRQLQFFYRRRLDLALSAAREMIGFEGDPALLEPERSDAVDVVRRLDDRHSERVRQVIGDFDDRLGEAALSAHPEMARHREEVTGALDGTAALLIAGGHVVVLGNRLSLFGLPGLLSSHPHLPLVAWSAGAMVLAPRVVLFHDSPPQGPGNAEVLTPGAGLLPLPLLPLPHAERRLRLGDPARVGVLARRFAPLVPVTLDPGSRLDLEGGRVVRSEQVRRLCADGRVTPFEPAEAMEVPRVS